MRSCVPALAWLPRYDRTWLRPDVVAGLTLWGLLVPEAMAYAGIAGLPPGAGLYTLVASLLVYAFVGTSRHLSVGATSATAALLAATVVSVGAAPGTDAYGPTAVAFVLVVAALFGIAAVARLGFVTQFLSKPVMDGLVLGLAVFVAVGQLNKLLGVSKGEGNTVEKFAHVIRELPQANGATVLVSLTALAALFGLPRLSRSLPAGLIVLFGSIAVSSALDLEGAHGVAVAGKLPQGLPHVDRPMRFMSEQLRAGTAPAMITRLYAAADGHAVAATTPAPAAAAASGSTATAPAERLQALFAHLRSLVRCRRALAR